MPYSPPDYAVFGFVINEVVLLERAKSAGADTELAPNQLEYCKSPTITDEEIGRMHFYNRTLAMMDYVEDEIMAKVDIPELELQSVWIGDGDQIWCLSMPLAYSCKKSRTPEMFKQMVLLMKLLKSPYPPALWCSTEAPVPKCFKGKRIPAKFVPWRIESLEHK